MIQILTLIPGGSKLKGLEILPVFFRNIEVLIIECRIGSLLFNPGSPDLISTFFTGYARKVNIEFLAGFINHYNSYEMTVLGTVQL